MNVLDAYKSGLSLRETGKKFGISRETVRQRLIEYNVSRRNQPVEHHEQQIIILLYKNNHSIQDIADHTQRSKSTIGRVLHNAGVEMKRPSLNYK